MTYSWGCFHSVACAGLGAPRIEGATGGQAEGVDHLGGGGCDVCAGALGGLPCSGCMPADLKASAKAETLMGAKALLCVAERMLSCGCGSWEAAALLLVDASAGAVPVPNECKF